jgi:multiphosphoryl transfer protein
MSNLVLHAPLEGWCASLDEAPDPVFAGRMLGDGVALDPIGGTLFSPCDGELIVVPASKHAVTIRAANGAEILIHIGIDTVELRGEGFELHVREGDTVRRGDRLISFDLDLLARRAKSLITPMIIVNGDAFQIASREINRAVRAGDALFELRQISAITTSSDRHGPARSRRVVVPLEHGIHARPAALFAACAKRSSSAVAVHAHGRTANGKSAVSLMSLGIRHGEEMLIEVAGADADETLAALEATLLGGTVQGKTGTTLSSKASREPVAFEPTAKSDSSAQRVSATEISPSDANSAPGSLLASVSVREPEPVASGAVLRGVIASRGLAVGRAVQLVRAEIQVAEAGAGVQQESQSLRRAHDAVRAELQRRVASSHGAQREIAEAHLEFIDDPELLAAANGSIHNGKSAGFAWRNAIQSHITLLQGTGDARLTERVDDLLDLENQMLRAITGQSPTSLQDLPGNAILIAKELLPSQLALIDPQKLAGLCTAAGGPTSHVAILASALGIPALVAAGPAVLSIANGMPLVLDAENGFVRIDPPAADLQVTERTLSARRARRAAEQAAAQRDCRTSDGTRIEVFANAGSLADARAAVAQGAEGCGLLRTEFLFLDRQTPPDEHEQAREYQAIAAAFAPRPIVVRTLDIGGDKPIPYLPLPREDTPALGLRGVRTSLWRMDLFRTQLRAILRVQPHEQCSLLLPMITSPAEVRAVRAVLDELRQEAKVSATLPLGVMIETPASAIIADQLAQESDFLSIGTNDLTQYTLAMDRGHPELASQLDALHPAVLRLIASTTKAARAHNRPVAVCGGLASDPIAAPILIGLGVTELSAIPSVIPQLKALIGGLSMDECRDLARQALEQGSAEAVRALLRERATDATGAHA